MTKDNIDLKSQKYNYCYRRFKIKYSASSKEMQMKEESVSQLRSKDKKKMPVQNEP